MSRIATVSVFSRIRSARVDFPWSICAIMQKFLILSFAKVIPLFVFAYLYILIITQSSEKINTFIFGKNIFWLTLTS